MALLPSVVAAGTWRRDAYTEADSEAAPALRDEPHRDVHRTLRLEEGDDALLSQRVLPLGDNLLVQAQVRVFLVQVIHVELLEQALPELLGIDLGLQPCSE